MKLVHLLLASMCPSSDTAPSCPWQLARAPPAGQCCRSMDEARSLWSVRCPSCRVVLHSPCLVCFPFSPWVSRSNHAERFRNDAMHLVLPTVLSWIVLRSCLFGTDNFSGTTEHFGSNEFLDGRDSETKASGLRVRPLNLRIMCMCGDALVRALADATSGRRNLTSRVHARSERWDYCFHARRKYAADPLREPLRWENDGSSRPMSVDIASSLSISYMAFRVTCPAAWKRQSAK